MDSKKINGMNTISQKTILALIIRITLIPILNGCKTKEEGQASEMNLATDTLTVDEIADTDDTVVTEEAIDASVTTKTKPVTIQKPLTITIQNLESATAPVYISVYGVNNKFPNPKGQLKEYKFKAHGNEMTVKIHHLKFGTYALASYQDVNSDGKIGKNFIGIPTEGFAFSNNYKPTIKAPNFDDCSFIYNEKSNVVTMKMIQ